MELFTPNLRNHLRNATGIALFLAVTTLLAPDSRAQLHWPGPPKKEALRVRLVAVALSLPRSTFFSSEEVLIAEKELSSDEWGLIKLVYSFLPYQPRLTETGFDYSVIHKLTAARNPNCDETIAQLTSRQSPRRETIQLKYSQNADTRGLEGRRVPLPCYETSADDYTETEPQPAPPDE